MNIGIFPGGRIFEEFCVNILCRIPPGSSCPMDYLRYINYLTPESIDNNLKQWLCRVYSLNPNVKALLDYYDNIPLKPQPPPVTIQLPTTPCTRWNNICDSLRVSPGDNVFSDYCISILRKHPGQQPPIEFLMIQNQISPEHIDRNLREWLHWMFSNNLNIKDLFNYYDTGNPQTYINQPVSRVLRWTIICDKIRVNPGIHVFAQYCKDILSHITQSPIDFLIDQNYLTLDAINSNLKLCYKLLHITGFHIKLSMKILTIRNESLSNKIPHTP
ncbi:MAG: hypothetical protein MUO21_00940 [Nitrososphaeraceae archaeon]|nr:hypothetical protein [Nitrososphaeraceae archaeon]